MKISPSVDANEVAHFQSLAALWWQPDGPFWPLHLLNKTRLVYLKSVIGNPEADQARPFHGLRVLDVGCGGGLLAESMAALGAEVVGIDVVERNIETARLHAVESGLDIEYRLISAENLLDEGGALFDVVLNMEVVEHVADLDSFMSACCSLLKPGGKQVMATINRSPWSWFAAVFVAERVLRLLPVGTHHWAKLRRPEEMRGQLVDRGCEILAQTGIKVNPFKRQMSLTTSLAINYMLVAQKRS